MDLIAMTTAKELLTKYGEYFQQNNIIITALRSLFWFFLLFLKEYWLTAVPCFTKLSKEEKSNVSSWYAAPIIPDRISINSFRKSKKNQNIERRAVMMILFC